MGFSTPRSRTNDTWGPSSAITIVYPFWTTVTNRHAQTVIVGWLHHARLVGWGRGRPRTAFDLARAPHLTACSVSVIPAPALTIFDFFGNTTNLESRNKRSRLLCSTLCFDHEACIAFALIF